MSDTTLLHQIVKVGLKGRHMAIPDGWEKVTSGPCKEDDMFANLMTLKWTYVDNEDLTLMDGKPMDAESFDCLIRRKKSNVREF